MQPFGASGVEPRSSAIQPHASGHEPLPAASTLRPWCHAGEDAWESDAGSRPEALLASARPAREVTLTNLPYDIKGQLLAQLSLTDAAMLSATCHIWRQAFIDTLHRRPDWANALGNALSAAYSAGDCSRPWPQALGTPTASSTHAPPDELQAATRAPMVEFCKRHAARATTTYLYTLSPAPSLLAQLRDAMPETRCLDAYPLEAYAAGMYSELPSPSMSQALGHCLGAFAHVHSFRSMALAGAALASPAFSHTTVKRLCSIQRHRISAVLPDVTRDGRRIERLFALDAFLGDREQKIALFQDDMGAIWSRFLLPHADPHDPYAVFDLKGVGRIDMCVPASAARRAPAARSFSSTSVLRAAADASLIYQEGRYRATAPYSTVLSTEEMLNRDLQSVQALHMTTPQVCSNLFPVKMMPYLKEALEASAPLFVAQDAEDVSACLSALELRLLATNTHAHLQHMHVGLLLEHVSFFAQLEQVFAQADTTARLPPMQSLFAQRSMPGGPTLGAYCHALLTAYPKVRLNIVGAAARLDKNQDHRVLSAIEWPFGTWRVTPTLGAQSEPEVALAYEGREAPWAFEVCFAAPAHSAHAVAPPDA